MPIFPSGTGLFLLLILVIPSKILLADGKRDTFVVLNNGKHERTVKAQIYKLDEKTRMIFYKPRPFEFVTNVPSDFSAMYKTSVRKENLMIMFLPYVRIAQVIV